MWKFYKAGNGDFSMYLAQHYEEHVRSSLEMVCHESLRTAVDYWNLKEPPKQ